MVHLAPLPGAPGYRGSMRQVVDDAVGRATLLAAHGFDAVMVENFGDAPFYADSVPPITVAAMTSCVEAVMAATGATVGVNVLRNDARAAVAVAAVTGAAFIRVNVLSGTMYTDQGPIVGRAADVARQRSALAPGLLLWADVFVKHATPPPGTNLEHAALDTWERGGADALVVSGALTGRPADVEELERVAAAVPDAPLVVGSGATGEALDRLSHLADHIIVGTALEHAGRPGAPLDDSRVASFVEAARAAGLFS